MRSIFTFMLVAATVTLFTGNGLLVLPLVGLFSLVALFSWYYYGSFLSKRFWSN